MKKFVEKLLIVALLILGIDLLVGVISDKVVMNMPETSAYISKTTHSLLKKKADIIVLGASKAKHGYNPFMLEDSMGLSCYNAAEDGCDMMYYDMMLSGFLSRCNPKIVIIDMAPLSLMNTPSIQGGKFLYGLSTVVDSFYNENLSWGERIKIKSALYRFNGFYGQMASNVLNKNLPNKGYTPITGFYKDGKIMKDTVFTPNEKEIEYMNDVVAKCKKGKVRLIMCVSPSYHYNPLFDDYLNGYCKQHKVEFFDLATDKKFIHPTLFKDADHLNTEGSKLFTQDFIKRIKTT